MTTTKSHSRFYEWLLFFISPLIATWVSIKNFRQFANPNILWAFVIFFGFTFAIGSENQGSDINRYVYQLKQLYQQSFTFQEGIDYFFQSGEADVMRIFIALVLSRFTDNTLALTTVYAVIFGYFFSRNFFYLLEKLEGKIKPWTWFLLLVFFLIVPYWKLNGFRFWTATHIFIFGLLPYIFEGKTKRLLFCFVPLLFHFSFITPLLILFTYRFLPKNISFLFYFFLLTTFVNQLDVTMVKNAIASVAPNIYVERTEGYLAETKTENLRSGSSGSEKNWYAVWNSKALSFSVVISFILVYLNYKKNDFFEIKYRALFCFSLWFGALANLLSSFPSGGRFVIVGNLMCFFLIIVGFQNIFSPSLQKRIIMFTGPLLILFVIVGIRSGFYANSITTALGNPIVALFFSEHTSLNDIIK